MAGKRCRAAADSRVATSAFSDAVKPPLAVRPSDLTLLLSVRGNPSRMPVAAPMSNRSIYKTSYGYCLWRLASLQLTSTIKII